MNNLLQQHLEPERIANVETAINLISDINDIKEIQLLSGGYSSSRNYKLITANEIFMLRVMGLDQPLEDRQKQIECLFIAAKAHVAPFCYFANAETGILIMEYLEPQPLNQDFDFLGNFANILYQLHSLEFPPPHQSIYDYTRDLEAELRTAQLSSSIKLFFEHIQAIKSILQPHLIKTACHNDLNPHNFIFDGQRIFLIDWEAAGSEDPFFDLATVCNFFTSSHPSAEDYFLMTYFGYEPSDIERAKLCLMKALSYYFYALHFLQFAQQAGLSLENEMSDVPTYQEWAIGFSTQQYGLQTGADFLLLGNVLTHAALNTINTEIFEKSQKMLLRKL